MSPNAQREQYKYKPYEPPHKGGPNYRPRPETNPRQDRPRKTRCDTPPNGYPSDRNSSSQYRKESPPRAPLRDVNSARDFAAKNGLPYSQSYEQSYKQLYANWDA